MLLNCSRTCGFLTVRSLPACDEDMLLISGSEGTPKNLTLARISRRHIFALDTFLPRVKMPSASREFAILRPH